MKSTICLFVLMSISSQVFARPQDPSSQAVITKYDFQNNDDGGYSYAWTSSDGITREEIAEVQNAGTENEFLLVRGFYAYTGPDGQEYKVGYTSHPDYGFEAEGEHTVKSAGTYNRGPVLGIPSAALASLAGGGLGK